MCGIAVSLKYGKVGSTSLSTKTRLGKRILASGELVSQKKHSSAALDMLVAPTLDLFVAIFVLTRTNAPASRLSSNLQTLQNQYMACSSLQ